MTVPVSVVVPCYRCAATIGRAVASIAAQTCLPREVILVEDASGDGGETLSALHEAERAHGQALGLRILALDANVGPGGARNIGWDAATQPLVAFLDADDAWHPRKLELQAAWMLARPTVAMTGHAFVTRRAGEPEPVVEALPCATRVSFGRLLLLNVFPTPSVMLRRELTVRFEPSKRSSEDFLLWLRIVASGGDAWRFDAPLVSLFKSDFGEGGLSGALWRMELGELDTFRRLHRERVLSLPRYLAAALLSLVKFTRRVAVSTVRRIGIRDDDRRRTP